MKVVFLDIDGVLNSGVYHDRLHVMEKLGTHTDVDEFDTEAILKLNRLLSSTGALVVISSSWRTSHPISYLWSLMKQHGFTGRIIGATPRGRLVLDDYHGYRGDEIMAWLEWTDGITGYVVFDDYPAEMMRGTEGHFVRTIGTYGLQDEDVDRAIEILNDEITTKVT